MGYFVSMDDAAKEYQNFVQGVQKDFLPKDGTLHTYILDIHEDSSKTQYYTNLMLQLLQSKGYEIVDVQYQYAISTITDDGVVRKASPDHLAIQRERSIMFLYK